MLARKRLFSLASHWKPSPANIKQVLIQKRTLYTNIVEPAGSALPSLRYNDIFLVQKIQDLVRIQSSVEEDLEGLDLNAPLGVAIDLRSLGAVQFLLNKGADPNGCSHVIPISHLAHAARTHNQEIFLALLDYGANPEQVGALWEAAETGNVAAAKVLIERGVDVDEVILHESYKAGDNPAWKFDEHHEFNLHWKVGDFIRRSNSSTPLHIAIYEHQAEMVEFLLSKGANIYFEDSTGETPLTVADSIGCGHPDAPEQSQDELDRIEKIQRMLRERNAKERRLPI